MLGDTQEIEESDCVELVRAYMQGKGQLAALHELEDKYGTWILMEHLRAVLNEERNRSRIEEEVRRGFVSGYIYHFRLSPNRGKLEDSLTNEVQSQLDQFLFMPQTSENIELMRRNVLSTLASYADVLPRKRTIRFENGSFIEEV